MIQYLSGKSIPKHKIGSFSTISPKVSPIKNRMGNIDQNINRGSYNNRINNNNSNIVELNIIAICNKLKGLFDQYIHYKYNMSKKLVQGQPSTENSFIIGQLNINKSYMYYRKSDKQLCFSRIFTLDEIDFVENIIERLHELIHCITNSSSKNYINFVLFRIIKLISKYPIIHPLFYIRIMLLLYEQTEDINEGLCDTLSRIISIMSSVNYGFPDITILKMDKSSFNNDNQYSYEEDEDIGKDFLKKYLSDNNEYSIVEKIKPIEVILYPYINNSKYFDQDSKFNDKRESILLRIVCGIFCFMKSQSSIIHLLTDNDIKTLNMFNSTSDNKDGN